MRDDEIEATLRRYQSPLPPDRLRGAALSRQARLQTIDWTLIATAAVLAIAAMATWPENGGAPAAPADPAWLAQVEAAAAEFDRGPDAIALAGLAMRVPTLPISGMQEEH